jgi:hypothetical protein
MENGAFVSATLRRRLKASRLAVMKMVRTISAAF